MSIGFGRKDEEKSDSQIETLRDLEKLFLTEIRSFQEFEQSLLIELKEVQDIENNFKKILAQFESIEKLAKTRVATFQKILIEMQKDKALVNIDHCQEYFRIIALIDKQLGPMVQTASNSLDLLILTRTHTLYAENERNREKMKTIDQDARKLRALILTLQTNLSSHGPPLQDMEGRIQRLSL